MANGVTKATTTVPGKRTKETLALVDAVLDNIEAGEYVTDACIKAGVKRKTFYLWKSKDPEIESRFIESCKIGETVQEEEAAKIGKTWATTGLTTKVKKVYVQILEGGKPKEGLDPDQLKLTGAVEITEEHTINPGMSIKIMAMRGARRLVDAQNKPPGGETDILKILEEAGGVVGLTPTDQPPTS